MNSVTNKTRSAEKRYRDKLTRDEKEIGLKNKKQRKTKKIEKLKGTLTIIIINYKKQKRQQNYKRKNNMNPTEKEL